jgi:hypothetical protein
MGGTDENHCLDLRGLPGRHVEQRHAAGADSHRPEACHRQLIEQGEHVCGGLAVGELSGRVRGPAVATQVGDNQPEVLREVGSERFPVLATTAESVQGNERLSRSLLLVVHLDVVDADRAAAARNLSLSGHDDPSAPTSRLRPYLTVFRCARRNSVARLIVSGK